MAQSHSTGPASVQEIPKREKTERNEKPTRILPTARINPSKQLEMGRAFAAASANASRSATIVEVAEIVKNAASTVALITPFFNSIQLLQRVDAGSYLPSKDLIAFLRAYEWNPETAAHRLANSMRDSWFGQILIPRMTFAPLDEEAAISLLAEAASAGPEYRKELCTILEFLELTGVIQRDGNLLKLLKAQSVSTDASAASAQAPSSPDSRTREVEPIKQRVNSTFDQTPTGGVQFNVNVQVDMAEFADWQPERITAFFRGIAEVLAAKAAIERTGSQRN